MLTILLVLFSNIFSSKDTLLPADSLAANQYYERGLQLAKEAAYDSAIYYYDLATNIYLKHKLYLDYAAVCNSTCIVIRKKTDYHGAISLVDSCLNCLTKQKAFIIAKSDSCLWNIRAANLINSQGNVFFYASRLAEAEENYKRALAQKKSCVKDPNELSSILMNLGNIQAMQNNFKNANNYYTQALAYRIEVLGKDHIDVGRLLINIAVNYRAIGEYEQAEATFNLSEEILYSNKESTLNDLSYVHHNYGELLIQRGDYSKAIELIWKAIELRRQMNVEKDAILGKFLNNLGVIYYFLGDYENAIHFHQQALSLRTKTLGEAHIDVGESYLNFGVVYKDMGDLKQAMVYYEKAIEIRQRILGEKHPDIASIYGNISNVYFELKMFDKCKFYNRSAIEILRNKFDQNNITLAHAYFNQVQLYKAQNNLDSAEIIAKKSLQIVQNIFKERKHPDLCKNYLLLGDLQVQRQKSVEEKSLLRSLHWNALGLYQQAIIYIVEDFYEKNVYENPKLNRVINQKALLDVLVAKGDQLYSRGTKRR